MRASILMTIFLGLCLCPPAWARRDCGQDWRQISTDHFVIIYPQVASEAAAQTAIVAEKAYPKVQELAGYAPGGPTPIVLNAFQDHANGFAMPIYHKLEFYLASPTGKWDGTLNRSWLESLMAHEFTHLCYGTRAEGLTRGLTWIFGGINDLNFIAPGWWTEGVAEYAETKLTGGGRGRNPYHRMKLAANLLSGQAWSLGQAGNAPNFVFPFDRTYVAGYDLLVALAETVKDPQFLDRASAGQSSWPLFGIGFMAAETFQVSLGKLFESRWEELQRVFALQYGPERPAAPGSRTLAEDAQAFFSQPCWQDGGHLAVFSQDLNQGPRLVRMDIDSGAQRVLGRPALLTGTLGYAPAQKKIYYARLLPGPWDEHTLTADLFSLDAQGERRLTFGGRCWSPDVSAAGRLVCVLNRFGPTQLATADSADGRLTPIPAVTGATYLSPRWSPDGRRLAAAVHLAGRQDVCLVDPATGTLTALCGWDPAGDHDPCWSPDGSRLFFVSDRTGVHQIYAYELENRECFQVTDARLGAFEPAISPDGKLLAFTEYRPGNTQRVMLAGLDPAGWKPADLPAAQQPPAPTEFLLPPAQGRGYSAWPHLLPTFWLPLAAEDSEGLIWGGISGRQDPLEMHSWQAQAFIQPKTSRLYGEISYANEETFLILSSRIYSRPLSRWNETPGHEDRQRCWARSQGFELEAGLPVNLFQAEDRSGWLRASVGYTAFGLSEQEPAGFASPAGKPASAFPDSGYTGVRAGLQAVAARQTARDLFPTSGADLQLQGRLALPGHGYHGSFYTSAAGVSIPSWFAHQAFRLEARGQAVLGLFPDTPDTVYPSGYASQFGAQDQALTLSAAYRFPLAYLDQGPGLFPVFFHSLWGEAFTDWGYGWSGGLQPGEWARRAVTSVGLTANLDLQVLWFLPGKLSQSLVRRQDGSWTLNLNLTVGM